MIKKCIHIIYKYKGLYNSVTFYLAAHLLILFDEASQCGVLVANLPPLVNNDSH